MTEPKKTLLEEAKARFKLADEAWSDNRKAYVEDLEFRMGKQWPDAIVDEREKSGRPCLVVDKVQQYIRQVVNDGRQNRPSIKVRPVDDYGDDEVAEVFQGIIRHISDRSNADEAYDTALDCSVTGGFGFIRVLTEYAHEKTFNQEICIERVRNPLSVYLDPNHVKADGSDAQWGFFIDTIQKDAFKSQFPDAEKTDWVTDGELYGDGWIQEDTVVVVEYFYKEEVTANLHLLQDGTSVTEDEYKRAGNNGLPVPAIVSSRDIKTHKVKWAKLSGAEVLEERDWLGKYIPIVPVYGNEYDLEGKVIYTGLIRPAKDAQRLYNYSRSAFAERVALTPKAPYIAAAGQVDDYPEWVTANTENHSVLRYDPIDINGTPVGAPQRQQASDIPSGFAQDMQLSEHDIQSAIGMYAASLGQASNEKSGKAILARQREGDVATFHYMDNLNRAIRHLGRVLVDLIPKIYDSNRVVRVLGEDGTATPVRLDPMQQEAVRKEGSKSIYNLNVGEYDVSVSAGASYTTKRQEAAEAMVQLTQANPQLMTVIGDLMIRNMDWPGADEIADRLKLMLPPQLAQAEESENEIPPQIQSAMQQMQEQMQQMDQAIQQREQVIQQMQQEIKAKEESSEIEEKKVEIDAYNAETNRLKVVQTTMTPEQVQALVIQTMQQLLTPTEIEESPQQEYMEPPEVMEPQDPPTEGGFFSPEHLDIQ